MKNKILKAFLYNDWLKFGEIQRITGIRSNKLAYHLNKLREKKLIVEKEKKYSLSSNFEYIIPYVSNSQAVLPVILIAIGEGKRFFLHIRDKKPYKNFLGLPAGRLLIEESIADATKRIMKIKHKINVNFKGIKSISLEHLIKEGKVVHGFLLILVSASTKESILYTDIEKNKKTIIKSDYRLLKNNWNLNAKIETIKSKI